MIIALIADRRDRDDLRVAAAVVVLAPLHVRARRVLRAHRAAHLLLPGHHDQRRVPHVQLAGGGEYHALDTVDENPLTRE